MLWILFALGAALSWGLYGPALHRGQVELGNPMRALLCVGVAYFLIGVLVPLITLSYQGQLSGFTMKGFNRRDVGRGIGRRWGRMYNFCVPFGRVADLRHATRLRGSAAGECALLDVVASPEDFT